MRTLLFFLLKLTIAGKVMWSSTCRRISTILFSFFFKESFINRCFTTADEVLNPCSPLWQTTDKLYGPLWGGGAHLLISNRLNGQRGALINGTWVLYYPGDRIMIHGPWPGLISWFLRFGHIDLLCPRRDPLTVDSASPENEARAGFFLWALTEWLSYTVATAGTNIVISMPEPLCSPWGKKKKSTVMSVLTPSCEI